jgi:hypothetical protein
MAAPKTNVNALEDVALVAGTQQNLINLYSLDIYGWHSQNNLQTTYDHSMGKDAFNKEH